MTMKTHRAVFYEPGHFHAALTLRAPNPRLAPDIHVYATPGPERDAFVHLVESFNCNRRSEHATPWILHMHEGEQLLERLIQDGQGDLVVLAGRNNLKLPTIARLTRAGLHVLADKPWLTDSSQLPHLSEITTSPQLAMDIMTTRHAILTRLIHQVVHTQEVFGAFDSQDTTEPAIAISSVHHLYKTVNGQPLRRPAWYYDTTIQGDGLVDIQSHMIEQVQWWVLGDDSCDIKRDVSVDSARRWSTPVPLALFTASTGLSAFPEALLPAVNNGELAYACNGELRYCLRGVSVRQTAEWRPREPDGGSDFHHIRLRGTRCNIHVRQGPDTNYKAEVHLEPVGRSDFVPRLRAAIEAWQQRFPGLSCIPSDIGWQLITPPTLDHGHESHFALVLQEFLDHLDYGSWPEALRARIYTRYALIARALELIRQEDE